jgi:monoamine oxidase
MNGKLYFSGTETATQFGGYMEGAIISAIYVAEKIKSRFKSPFLP